MIIDYKPMDPFMDTNIPKAATVGAAGLDLSCNHDIWIYHNAVTRVPTNICLEIPRGYFGLLTLRSGWSVRYECTLANGVGIIDSDYRGEIIIPVYSWAPDNFVLTAHTRIAQIILLKHWPIVLNRVEHLTPTERSTGGFGSTGER